MTSRDRRTLPTSPFDGGGPQAHPIPIRSPGGSSPGSFRSPPFGQDTASDTGRNAAGSYGTHAFLLQGTGSWHPAVGSLQSKVQALQVGKGRHSRSHGMHMPEAGVAPCRDARRADGRSAAPDSGEQHTELGFPEGEAGPGAQRREPQGITICHAFKSPCLVTPGVPAGEGPGVGADGLPATGRGGLPRQPARGRLGAL